MTSPTDVATFHAEFDRHPGDRVRLFEAVANAVPEGAAARVLYAGSYIDIGPSIWFDSVTYVDVDKRAARFFAEEEPVTDLVGAKRKRVNRIGNPSIAFIHRDYTEDLPIEDESIDLLISLYAGFITEACGRYVRPGGLVLANNSHGDATMATLLGGYDLAGVVTARDGAYTVRTDGLESYLQPKRPLPTIDELRASGRGIGYTRQAFAYLFRRAG